MNRFNLLVLFVALAVGSLLVISCQSNEISKNDESAGLNGGFETTDSGYPVNWAFFPNPETNDVMTIELASDDAAEGEIALSLTSTTDQQLVGIRSKRVPVESGKDYRISMAVKNGGTNMEIVRTVMDASGKNNIRSDVIAASTDAMDEWQVVEESLSVADGEANVFLKVMLSSPGTVLLDDVRVEEQPG